LKGNPFCRRICCDVGPDEFSAAEPEEDEGIKQVETDSWNNEQTHGGNVRRVVAQEGSPSLAGWPWWFDHVLGDARLRDLKPEREQFAVDAWRAPQSNTRGAGLNPGRPAFAAATLEAANGMTSHSKTCYADIVKCLARRWARDAEFRLRAISLTLTMGDDQFTIDLLDHLLKF
jgi:hypothetical protein